MQRAPYDAPARMLAILLLVVAGACTPSPSATATATTTATTTTGATASTGGSSSTGDACDGASDCETEGICVAEYVSDTLGGERGSARCEDPSQCIQALDLGRWCFEHPSCCDGLRCRAIDGICELPDFGESTGTSGTGTSTSGSSTSGSSGSESTGSTGSTGSSTTGTDTDTDTGTTGM